MVRKFKWKDGKGEYDEFKGKSYNLKCEITEKVRRVSPKFKIKPSIWFTFSSVFFVVSMGTYI
ncbi:hypothetical protein DO021_14550 [Desulfobacter hydrogenophilus]|uniref:Uncharacterized protein n=1 Tax=Desulfobacter hydrogenophilus TaxID=2291 RepID=A0A328FCY8_9BACT|nr:hypothetical protein DO021_14550 [Desulfobacter hydrogenophilus]